MLEQLASFMQSKGFPPQQDLSGKIVRFKRHENKSNPSSWFYCRKVKIDDKEAIESGFGDFATGEEYYWDSTNLVDMLPDEKKKFEEARIRFQKERQAKLENDRAAARQLANLIWEGNPLVAEHPYLTKKNVQAFASLKLSDKGDLIVPVYIHNKLTSLQFISKDGQKKFLKGGEIKGACTQLQSGHDLNAGCFLAEGYATGATIAELFPLAFVYIAFNANNLAASLEYVRSMHRGPVFIAADNDHKTPGNPGISKALEAAHTNGFLSSIVLHPYFTPDQTGTDWNDYAALHGKEHTRTVLTDLIAGPPPTGTVTNVDMERKTVTISMHHAALVPGLSGIKLLEAISITPMDWKIGKQGKPTPPRQDEVGNMLNYYYGQHVMREKNDVFIWSDTHWVEVEPIDFKRFVRNSAQTLMGGLASDKDLNAYYNIFMDKLPPIPEGMSFYQQLTNVSNFLDGTLQVDQRKKSKVFRGHRKSDYITWVLPHHYKAPRAPNPVFEQWLERIFGDDPKKEEKLRALRQVGGACLVPVNPIYAFFLGEAQSGKSTFALLAKAFIGKGNFSMVPAHQLGEQKLTEMLINRRVNICTDIEKKDRVDSSLLKRMSDSGGLMVKRMYKTAIQAQVPLVHLYCGNSLPNGIDGQSEAMNRRVTIIKMDKPVPKGEMLKDFEQEIMDAGPGAILDFFEKGLDDLIQNGGFYANPGTDVLHEWKLENDPIGQFLDSVKTGEIEALYCNDTARIRQHELYRFYQEFWNNRTYSSRHAFYKAVRNKGFATVTIEGYDYFKGIGIVGKEVTHSGDDGPGGERAGVEVDF